jgi:hypothetical protein
MTSFLSLILRTPSPLPSPRPSHFSSLWNCLAPKATCTWSLLKGPCLLILGLEDVA